MVLIRNFFWAVLIRNPFWAVMNFLWAVMIRNSFGAVLIRNPFRAVMNFLWAVMIRNFFWAVIIRNFFWAVMIRNFRGCFVDVLFDLWRIILKWNSLYSVSKNNSKRTKFKEESWLILCMIIIGMVYERNSITTAKTSIFSNIMYSHALSLASIKF